MHCVHILSKGSINCAIIHAYSAVYNFYHSILVPPTSMGVTTTENGHIENPSATIVIMIVPSCSEPEYKVRLKFTWITKEKI